MNKSDLKNFAINARLELLQRVADRAGEYGIDEEKSKTRSIVPSDGFQKLGGTLLTNEEIQQRNALILRVYEKGYRQTMEEAAYTWFNRFIAIRYMQAHNLLPVRMIVLPDAPGVQPQLLREAQDVELPGADMGHILDMLTASDADGLYKYLLILLCNALSESLPGMFEQISDVTELLFPEGLLRSDSVLGEMAKLDADIWNEIQVVGWLYQYYNTQLKDETFELLRKNVKITRDRIGPATQLFTPEWIVNYMVENSLGRLWLEGHPSESLRMKWRYYMDEAKQEPEVAARLAQIRQSYASMQPEDIRLLDPCMGSGHILVYAFDVLMEIYRSVGYTDRDAVRSIMENNLFGLDIDDRAAQLAYFAVMMKACEYDRRFLKRGVQPHVCAIRESAALTREQLNTLGAERTLAERLLRCFADAKEYGSLLHVDFTPEELNRLDARLAEMKEDGGNLLDMADRAAAHAAVAPLMDQARILARKYDAVITNPPYMGSSGMNEKLSRFVKDNYPDSKSDLFAVFMERCGKMLNQTGYQAMITQHAWMFLSSYEKLRGKLQARELINMAHLGPRAFEDIGGEVVQTTAFVLQRNHIEGYKGSYARLIEPTTQDGKEEMFLTETNRYIAQQENFKKIPGMPVAYWVTKSSIEMFDKGLLGNSANASVGIQTGDNDRFIRLWWEINPSNIILNISNVEDSFQEKKWFPYNKGGEYRKWIGNQVFLINWKDDGAAIKRNSIDTGHHYQQYSDEYKFKPLVTWSRITSGLPSFRYRDVGSLSDMAGFSLFASKRELIRILAFCNSKVACYYLSFLSPTLNIMVGQVLGLPYQSKDESEEYANECITISMHDWDSFETSWDFKKHPMI